MRVFVFTVFLLSATGLCAQTSVIGLKSHHGNITELQHAPDQFGVIPPQKSIDTIAKIDSDCIIQIGTETDWGREIPRQFRDTVCGHWYYQQVNYDLDQMQEFHHETIVFVGFEDASEIKEKKKKRGKKGKKPRWLFFPLLFITLGTATNEPKKK